MYFVHNYSEEASLIGSKARVVVFRGKKQILDISAPEKGKSDSLFWHVFNIDGNNNKLTLINELQDSPPALIA